MKPIVVMIAVFCGCVFTFNAKAQVVNWGHFENDTRHVVNVNLNWDYASTGAVYYGYRPKAKIPLLVGADVSMPAGSVFGDDFKSRIGVQLQPIRLSHFRINANIQGVFRRYHQPIVTLLNFGSDVSTTIGYYHKAWFAAAEVGFDKAIVTHFKHTNRYKESFAAVQDGWYEPATGGNFYYGLQVGASYKKHDFYLKVGRLLTQDFKTTPLVPFYGQLGYSIKFARSSQP